MTIIAALLSQLVIKASRSAKHSLNLEAKAQPYTKIKKAIKFHSKHIFPYNHKKWQANRAKLLKLLFTAKVVIVISRELQKAVTVT